jgi:acylphosphatase
MGTIAKHIIFIGHVQGVGFRYTTHRIARRYDLVGFVRNLPDGTVEALLQGPADEVETCLQDIQESFAGYLRETKIESVPADLQHIDFQITF